MSTREIDDLIFFIEIHRVDREVPSYVIELRVFHERDLRRMTGIIIFPFLPQSRDIDVLSLIGITDRAELLEGEICFRDELHLLFWSRVCDEVKVSYLFSQKKIPDGATYDIEVKAVFAENIF